MSILLVLKSMVTGILVSASVGPVLVLSFKNTVTKNWVHGFFTGLGSTTGDAFYCIMAVIGTNWLHNFLKNNDKLFNILTGIILIIFSILIYSHKNSKNNFNEKINDNRNLFKQYLKTFILAFSNPMTFFGILMLFGLLKLYPENSIQSNITIFSGYMFGGILWWIIFTNIVKYFKKYFSYTLIRKINIGSSIIVFFVGCLIIIKNIFFYSINN